MNGSRINTARNAIGGCLIGYGCMSFFCFILLEIIWARTAPIHPDHALGLVYRHNEHGSYTYFSEFQATACWLMFNTSIPLPFIGIFVAPRKNVSGVVRWYGAGFKWEQDDPRSMMKWAAIASSAATPLFLFFIGPHIVYGLNAASFVMNLG